MMTEQLPPRIPELNDQDASPAAKAVFNDARQRIGVVPNVYRAMAYSPAILNAFAKMLGAVETSGLDRKFQQQIAVAVAQFDRYTYCLAVNTAIGLHVGLLSKLSAAQMPRRPGPLGCVVRGPRN